MSTTVSDADQCVALTTDGERCSRPAGDDGFCHQHDPSDETVDGVDPDAGDDDGGDAEGDGTDDESEVGDEEAADDETADDETADEEEGADEEVEDEGESVDAESTDADGEGEEPTGGADDQETDMASSDSESAEMGIGEVRQTVQATAEGVVGHPLDGITSVDATDEGWRVAVEVVERKSVPDTQDILGRYELTLDDDLSVTGYQRTHRYRRDDMNHDI